MIPDAPGLPPGIIAFTFCEASGQTVALADRRVVARHCTCVSAEEWEGSFRFSVGVAPGQAGNSHAQECLYGPLRVRWFQGAECVLETDDEAEAWAEFERRRDALAEEE